MNEVENKNRIWNWIRWIFPLFLIGMTLSLIYSTPFYQNEAYRVKSIFTKTLNDQPQENVTINEEQTLKNIGVLTDNMKKLVLDKPYIIINTTDNKFILMRTHKDTVRTGNCSTGSNRLLVADNYKQLFMTPKGMFTIINKRKNPVWTKPNWAFIEEGLPVPSARSASRIETGVLGDYALGFGNGYMLHGTLYQRFLGLPVTHGCVRLGDDDLEVIFNTLETGSKVLIY